MSKPHPPSASWKTRSQRHNSHFYFQTHLLKAANPNARGSFTTLWLSQSTTTAMWGLCDCAEENCTNTVVLCSDAVSISAAARFWWCNCTVQLIQSVGSLTHRLVSGVGVDLLRPWWKWTPGPLSSNKCWASQPTVAASALNHKASRPRALNQQHTARRVQSQETLVLHLTCLQVCVDLQAGCDAQARSSNGCDIRVTRVDHRVLKREREENPLYVAVYCKFEAKIKEAGRNTLG